MARLYQKINNEAVPLDGGGGGSVAIDNITITKNSNDEIQVAPALTGKINQLNNSAADMGKVLTANGNGTASWDDILVPIDYETITKNGNGELQVSSVPYDNTESGLTADNVQDAIDELNSNLNSDVAWNTSADGKYQYTKKNGVVCITTVTGIVTTVTSSWASIMSQLPVGYRPKVQLSSIMISDDGMTLPIRITTSGSILSYHSGSNVNEKLNFTFTFVAD